MQSRKLFSITDSVISFQQALCAVAPIAEKIEIRWKEPDNYDSWDCIAKGLYEGFILIGIRSSKEGMENGLLPFVRYDERISDYSNRSYIAAKWQNEIYPLICLETTSTPFDTCLLAKIDTNGKLNMTIKVPIRERKFVAVLKGSSGSKIFDSISY